jgi:hypothetical protein
MVLRSALLYCRSLGRFKFIGSESYSTKDNAIDLNKDSDKALELNKDSSR